MKLDTALLAETPEGIDIRLRPAGVPARALAYLVDWTVRVVLLIIVGTVAGLTGGLGTGLMLVTYFGLEWLYPIVFELLPGAATPGKRVMGLQVTMDDGLPVTPAASVTRNLLRAVDLLPFNYALGIVTSLVRRDFKRVGDVVAGTLVVHVESSRLVGALPDAEALAPRVPLTRARQMAILHLAGRADRLTSERVDELAALAEVALPPPDVVPPRGGLPLTRPGPRLLAVAQWLAGQR